MKIRNIEDVKSVVYGGAFFGGGGGGHISEGLKYAELALNLGGEINILEPNEIDDEQVLVTVSVVGSQAAEERYLRPIHLVRAVEVLRENGVRIDGLIPCEMGGVNSVNGWIQSAILKIPVVDIPCDGRAHPTSVMGSMGLHKVKNYISKQAVAGGDPETGKYLELFVSGSLQVVSRFVRKAAEEAGGEVAVARNPVEARYAKIHGASGAIKQSMKIGKIIIEYISRDRMETCYKVFEVAKGEVIGECKIDDAFLETRGGFDIGIIKLACGSNRYEMVFFNEYMTLERNDQRIATFPDLIVLMNPETGLPMLSAEALKSRGKTVIVGYVHKEHLILGDGVKHPEVYIDLEKIINKNIARYL